jgi:hypothetical protein
MLKSNLLLCLGVALACAACNHELHGLAFALQKAEAHAT